MPISGSIFWSAGSSFWTSPWHNSSPSVSHCSFFFGHESNGQYIFAVIFAVIGASILSFSRQISRFVNIEAFIGVLYVFSLAGSVLILDRTPHGLEEFKAIMNGNILWLTPKDILHAFVLYAVIGVFQFIFRKKFFGLTYGTEYRFVWEFLFFLSFAFVLVSSVQIAGILQVFAFLVIPALIGRLYTREPSKILLGGLGHRVPGQCLWSLFFLPSGYSDGALDRRLSERSLLYHTHLEKP